MALMMLMSEKQITPKIPRRSDDTRKMKPKTESNRFNGKDNGIAWKQLMKTKKHKKKVIVRSNMCFQSIFLIG